MIVVLTGITPYIRVIRSKWLVGDWLMVGDRPRAGA